MIFKKLIMKKNFTDQIHTFPGFYLDSSTYNKRYSVNQLHLVSNIWLSSLSSKILFTQAQLIHHYTLA